MMTERKILHTRNNSIADAFMGNRSTKYLTHWGRVTHIGVSKLTNIGSDNGLSPRRRQAIIWTNTVNWTLKNKLQWYFNRNSYIFIQENAFENVWNMAAIFPASMC